MAKDEWWKNEDGTLKCFGKAYEYSNEGQSFHCAQLIGCGDCNETLKRECWKPKEHDVKLSNQEIIEFAYLVKEMVGSLAENQTKLFVEQANCYTACFNRMRQLLKLVDSAELRGHQLLVEFYREGRELDNSHDRLSFDEVDQANKKSLMFKESGKAMEIPF